MAKAKSTKKAGSTDAAKKQSSGKNSEKAAVPATALIDTSLAAESAARMIGAKASGSLPAAAESGGAAQAGRKESSAFKQMKETMAKPHAASVDALLNNTASPVKGRGGHSFGGGKQVGHNQTFGADVSRRNLPRRTGG